MPNRLWPILPMALCGAAIALIADSKGPWLARHPDAGGGDVATAKASESDSGAFARRPSVRSEGEPSGAAIAQPAGSEPSSGSKDDRAQCSSLASMPRAPSASVLGGGSAVSPEASSPVANAADDRYVTGKVSLALASDAMLARRAIAVSTRDGEVRLRGILGSQAEIDHAIAIARGVEGVYGIADELAAQR